MKIEFGQIFENNKNESFEVINHLGMIKKSNVYLVRFIETNNYQLVARINITNGKVRDYSKPFCFGVGYAKTEDDVTNLPMLRYEDAFVSWESMLRRCYSGQHSLYDKVSVCDEWHNFYNFKKWYLDNYPLEFFRKNIALDKDLFAKDGVDKVYSPDTCCFIPSSINSQIRGLKNNYNSVYDNYPEKLVYRFYQLVNEYKDILSPRVYDVLNKEYFKKYIKNKDLSQKKLSIVLEEASMHNIELVKYDINALVKYNGSYHEFINLAQLESFLVNTKREIVYRNLKQKKIT